MFQHAAIVNKSGRQSVSAVHRSVKKSLGITEMFYIPVYTR